jgi:hypothetical protein
MYARQGQRAGRESGRHNGLNFTFARYGLKKGMDALF